MGNLVSDNQMLYLWTKLNKQTRNKQTINQNKRHTALHPTPQFKINDFLKNMTNLLTCVLAFKHAMCIQILMRDMNCDRTKSSAPRQTPLGVKSSLGLCFSFEKI